MTLRPLPILLCVFLLGGCATTRVIEETEKESIVSERYSQPWIKPYVGGDIPEKKALEAFNPDLYPREALDYIKKKEFQPVVWTGVIVELNAWPMFGYTANEVIIEHRFWDWMTTSNDELIYISDRGEGKFRCFFAPTELQEGHEVGDFVIVYGIPWGIEKEYLLFEGMRTKTLDQDHFTDEEWSYGASFVRSRDLDDLKILENN